MTKKGKNMDVPTLARHNVIICSGELDRGETQSRKIVSAMPKTELKIPLRTLWSFDENSSYILKKSAPMYMLAMKAKMRSRNTNPIVIIDMV